MLKSDQEQSLIINYPITTYDQNIASEA